MTGCVVPFDGHNILWLNGHKLLLLNGEATAVQAELTHQPPKCAAMRR